MENEILRFVEVEWDGVYRFYGQERNQRPSPLHRAVPWVLGEDISMTVIVTDRLGQGEDERGSYVELSQQRVFVDLTIAEARRLAAQLVDAADYAQAFWDELDRVRVEVGGEG